jgi:uncharacterized protein (TIGR00251 family)
MSYHQFISQQEHSIELRLWVKPNSSQKGILGFNEHGIILAVQAPAHEGKANQAILESFAKLIGIPKSQLELVKGHKGRNKVIRIPNNVITQAFLKLHLDI